jgi:hypothetical protein
MIENISYTDGLITYKQGANANFILRYTKNGAVSTLAGLMFNQIPETGLDYMAFAPGIFSAPLSL